MRILIVAAVCVGITACAGTMRGMVRGTGEPVQMGYQQGMQHDELSVTLPDGETFTGKAVMEGRSTSLVQGFGKATAVSTSGAMATGRGSSFGVVSTYTGNVQAVLFGDRGRTMQCALRYADAGGFTAAGGIGVCEASDGKIVDVQW